MTFDEWVAANPCTEQACGEPYCCQCKEKVWNLLTARFAPLVEACEELLLDYACEIDAAAGGVEIRRRTLLALKAVKDDA